jgi:hypothetical protein
MLLYFYHHNLVASPPNAVIFSFLNIVDTIINASNKYFNPVSTWRFFYKGTKGLTNCMLLGLYKFSQMKYAIFCNDAVSPISHYQSTCFDAGDIKSPLQITLT